MSRTGRIVQGRAATALVTIAVALVIGLASPAMAHSDLASSDPVDGTTVEGPATEVVLVFAATIDFSASSFKAIDAEGTPRALQSVAIDDDGVTVTITLAEPVVDGVVGIGYSIVAGDSHPRTGFISFGVDSPPPTPPPTPTRAPTTTKLEPTTTPDGTSAVSTQPTPTPQAAKATPALTATPLPADTRDDDDDLPDLTAFLGADPDLDRMINARTAVRAVGYTAGVALIGGLLFFVLIARDRPSGVQLWILGVAAAATALSGIALIAVQASIVRAGATGALVDPGAWADALTGRFAVGVALRIAGGLGGLALLRGRSTAAAAAAGVTALSFPFLGHGASRDPLWLVFPADLVHVLAVAVWTGGLVMLLLGLATARPQASLPAAAYAPVAIVGRYSTFAGAALGAAAVTGTILAATELSDIGALLDTTYGKRLVVKLVFVAALVALGAFHRYRVVPRINAEGSDSPAVRKLLSAGAVEVGVMGMVVLISALLVNAAT